jgi:hypothetical protein
MTSYVALLRGINVGGKNKVPMPKLREVFATLGHEDVVTYIQSGNVVFRSAVKPAKSPATSRPPSLRSSACGCRSSCGHAELARSPSNPT